MEGNKISRRYIIDKFFERTNKKVTLQHIISRVVKENQKKYGHTKTLLYNTIQLFIKSFEIRKKCKHKNYFRWKKYNHKNYFYRHSSM